VTNDAPSKILDQINSILFRKGGDSAGERKLTKDASNMLIDLNIKLIEAYRPHHDPDVDRRAVRAIANLSRQVRV